MTPEATPERTVRTWLQMNGPEFGIQTPDVLELVNSKETRGAHHLTFQQTLNGIKVYGRFLHVNLNAAGLPTMATSSYAPHLEEVDSFTSVPSVSASQAERLARSAVSSTGATSSSAELLILPDSPPRLIWRVIAWPDSTAGEWEVLLDATSGDLVQLMDQRVYHRSPSKSGWRRIRLAP